MPKLDGTCKTCGKPITFYPSQARTFCSTSCRAKDRAASGMPMKPRRGVEVPCLNCQKPVYRMKHQLERDAFCDVDCKNSWQARGRVSRACGLCGAVFETPPSLKAQIYCSRGCMGAANYRRPLDRTHNLKPAVIDKSGYVRIFEPGHPAATRSGWIFEHRWIAEQALDRYLDRNEHVHHVNHIRHDNRPENLEVMSARAHSSITGRENGEALKAALEARQELAEYKRLYGPLP